MKWLFEIFGGAVMLGAGLVCTFMFGMVTVMGERSESKSYNGKPFPWWPSVVTAAGIIAAGIGLTIFLKGWVDLF